MCRPPAPLLGGHLDVDSVRSCWKVRRREGARGEEEGGRIIQHRDI